MDAVPGLPSFGLATRLRSFRVAPSIWLTILATLVILSTIRAALLFFRSTPSSQKVGVTLIPGVGVVQVEKGVRTNHGSLDNGLVMQEKREEKKMSSAFWGLVRWDGLPSLPLPRRDVGALSVSETERGRWTAHSQQEGLRIQLSHGKRPGPAFDRPCMCIPSVRLQAVELLSFFFPFSVWDHSASAVSIRRPCVNGQNDYVTTCE